MNNFRTHLAGRTQRPPCAPSLWLGRRTACVTGHGRRPAGSRWSCRTSAWARGRLLPRARLTRLCSGALDPCLARSTSRAPSGSWTASRKAAAPSPVPCCPHAGLPGSLPPFRRRRSPETLATGLFHSSSSSWLWFEPCVGILFFPPLSSLPLFPTPLPRLSRSKLPAVQATRSSSAVPPAERRKDTDLR